MLFVVKNILFIVMSCYFRLENSLNLFHHFLCWGFFFFGKQVKLISSWLWGRESPSLLRSILWIRLLKQLSWYNFSCWAFLWSFCNSILFFSRRRTGPGWTVLPGQRCLRAPGHQRRCLCGCHSHRWTSFQLQTWYIITVDHNEYDQNGKYLLTVLSYYPVQISDLLNLEVAVI